MWGRKEFKAPSCDLTKKGREINKEMIIEGEDIIVLASVLHVAVAVGS